ncbi:MAG: ABC transporter permease [Moheibacter sp.]
MGINKKIAWIHLSSKIRQLLVAVLSVTFGISMYIFMNGFMSGVNKAQTDIAFTSMAHLKIYNDLNSDPKPIEVSDADDNSIRFVRNSKNIRYTEGIKNAEPILESVQNYPEVTAVTEQLNENVFIRNGVTRINVLLSGIDAANEDRVFGLSKYMTDGDLFELEKRPDGIILGSKLAASLGVTMGDNINIMTADGITKNFKTIGMFETGAVGVDKTKAIISIQTARQIFSKNPNYATEILINISDFNKADELAEKMAPTTAFKVESWKEGNDQLDSANQLRNILAMAVSLTILIVAGFGIYNIMNMTVNEKIKEIAILKAMGFNGGDIVEIFLTQSVIIGCLGGLSGVILGNIISRIISKIPFSIASLTTLPIEFNRMDYLMAFLFGVIITLIAGYLPARKASKIDPVNIIRG